MTKRSWFITILLLLTTFVGVIFLDDRSLPVVVETNLEKLPMKIDTYSGSEDSFPEKVYQELNADKNIYRHYSNEKGEKADLYIGYYGTAKGGRTPHNPLACLSGAGWVVLQSSTTTLYPTYYPKGIKVNYMLARKGPIFETLLHWYQSEGDLVLQTGVQQNIRRFLGRVFHNRNDGAFVRLTVTSTEGDTAKAKKIAEEFSEKILNLLPNYWPIEKS
jgi:EpsI family protein